MSYRNRLPSPRILTTWLIGDGQAAYRFYTISRDGRRRCARTTDRHRNPCSRSAAVRCKPFPAPPVAQDVCLRAKFWMAYLWGPPPFPQPSHKPADFCPRAKLQTATLSRCSPAVLPTSPQVGIAELRKHTGSLADPAAPQSFK